MGEIAGEINATLSDQQAPLVPGDVIAVQFPRLPAWDQQDLAVQPDGHVSFLSIDEVHVAGMTVSQLDEYLTEQYTAILAEPELTVRTTLRAPRNVYVMGEVQQAGAFPIPTGRLSVLEALALSGGFIRDTAFLEHMMLVRWIPEENRVQTWKIDASLSEWSSETSILLQAHDVVFVPAKPIVHVNDWLDRYIRRMIPFPYLTFVQ